MPVMDPRDQELAHPEPGRLPRYDGNAVAGRLNGLLGPEPTLVRLRCGHCRSVGVLAETVVEQDAAAAIVRCRSCTRTLMTVWERDSGTEVVLAALAALEYPPADSPT